MQYWHCTVRTYIVPQSTVVQVHWLCTLVRVFDFLDKNDVFTNVISYVERHEILSFFWCHIRVGVAVDVPDRKIAVRKTMPDVAVSTWICTGKPITQTIFIRCCWWLSSDENCELSGRTANTQEKGIHRFLLFFFLIEKVHNRIKQD